MSKVMQRMSKIQTTGSIIHEGPKDECQRWLNSTIRQHTRNFLSNPRNAYRFASECFNTPIEEVSEEMIQSHTLFNFTYDHFTAYFLIKE